MAVHALLRRTSLALLTTAALVAVWCGSALAACPNEARREEQNVLYLPDCRAFEMVSPLDKNNSNVGGHYGAVVAAMNGDGVAYSAMAGFGQTDGSGVNGATQYVASRGPDGHWASHGVTPLPAQGSYQFTIGATALVSFSEDLSHGLVEGYEIPGTTGGIPQAVNYYREDTGSLSLETITQDVVKEPIFVLDTFGEIKGYAGDLSTVTFESPADLLPQTSGFEEKFYIWDRGTLAVAALPDGTLPPGGSVSARDPGRFQTIEQVGTVSANGAAAVFVTPGNGQLYLWRRGTNSAWVSESEGTVPVAEPQKVRFQAMTPDGKHVLFTTSDRLTDDDPGGEGVGLYLYTDSPSPETESNLHFVARVPDALAAEHYPGAVAGVSDDAKRIYFYGGLGAQQAGVYLWDEGTVRFVAAVAPLGHFGDFFAVAEAGQVSADGREFAFITNHEMPGYPNANNNLTELYDYHEATENVRCVSCSPSGALKNSVEIKPQLGSTFGVQMEMGLRVITRGGRYVVFSTPEALVPRDTNAVTDAYEYDTQTQTISLLSPGTQAEPAWIGSVDESGENVFIVTPAPLVRSDTDTLSDVYDVRVGGGVVQPAPQIGPCVGDECQGTPSAAPTFDTASGFTGLGNVIPAAKVTPKALTRAQKLARALRACRRRPEKHRRGCIRRAKRKYGPRRARKAAKPVRLARSGAEGRG